MTPAAAWIVADILADPNARAVTFGLDSALRLPFWAAAKTGTSKAMRDNWCVGLSDRFTIAVWVGNAEGDSMTRVSGTSGAAPIWREIMLALHRDKPGKSPARSAGIEQREVRFASATEPPRTEYFLPGTGQSDVAPAPPAARRPHITSPVSGAIYALDPDIPPARQRVRFAATGAAKGDRWRLDKSDVGPAAANQISLPAPGTHRLGLIGADGQMRDQVLFSIH